MTAAAGVFVAAAPAPPFAAVAAAGVSKAFPFGEGGLLRSGKTDEVL